MTTRTRPPVRERPPTKSSARRTPPPRRGGAATKFGLPALGGALCLGLLVGYLANSGGGGTKTVTAVHTVTAKAAPAAATASGPAARPVIALAVLNGSGQAGLAARTAQSAEALGYSQVAQGNAPSTVTASKVYYRADAAADARQVAQDLGLPDPVKLPVGGALEQAAPTSAQVVVVLGPDGASTVGAAAAPADSSGATTTGATATGASGAADSTLPSSTGTSPSAAPPPGR